MLLSIMHCVILCVLVPHPWLIKIFFPTVGVKKKFPRSIRTTGARLKKMGGERKLNGN